MQQDPPLPLFLFHILTENKCGLHAACYHFPPLDELRMHNVLTRRQRTKGHDTGCDNARFTRPQRERNGGDCRPVQIARNLEGRSQWHPLLAAVDVEGCDDAGFGAELEPRIEAIIVRDSEYQRAERQRPHGREAYFDDILRGAGSAAQWPVPHFLELGRRLFARGVAVLLTGELEEKGPPSPIPPGIVRVPRDRLTVRELAAVLAASDLVVSNSTGPLHMAVALGVPTISFFPSVGTAQAHRWGPYPAFVLGDSAHRVFVAPTAAGQPDMAGIGVEEVWEACQTRLAQVVA